MTPVVKKSPVDDACEKVWRIGLRAVARPVFRWQTDALVADTLRPGGCVQRVLHHLPKRQEVDLAWRRPAPGQPYTAAGLRLLKTQELHSVVTQLDIGRDFWN